ncbi:hypothetical protein RBSH_00648 [Rhodopirellula baltica SH28]|uniref:Uncharacterized protein n=1 Tax=Rhodopirellula baltica SH28 TaxID=993517 RepID=K5DAZ3_RHOBT|nr:hypothetical protein RBSH_00648 [Rhodopirellula baltica SH28]
MSSKATHQEFINSHPSCQQATLPPRKTISGAFRIAQDTPSMITNWLDRIEYPR